LLNFEKPTIAYTSQEIIDMTKTRLQKMDIELGELRDPIAPLCNAKNDTWNGLTCIHLKSLETNGNALLEGAIIFALELDEETIVAKISRGFDNIASNDDLTPKIASKSLIAILSHTLLEMIVRDSFRRNKEFEIIQVLKGADSDHAYMVTSSLDQRSKVLRSAVAIEGELVTPIPVREKLSATDIARKNCLVLIARNLNKGASPAQVEQSLRTLIGDKNIVSVYFPRAEAGLYARVANIELLNASVYKKFVKSTHKIQSKYIKLNPHPRSLDGSATPPAATLQELGFQDLNTALANTVVAMENATTAPKRSSVPKEELTSLVKDAIAEGNQNLKREIKADMQTLREDILAKSHTYTDIMTQDMRAKIDGQLDNIDNQFKAMMESLSTTRRLLGDTPQRKALPSSEQGHSN
jgi:hypothetical protein